METNCTCTSTFDIPHDPGNTQSIILCDEQRIFRDIVVHEFAMYVKR